VAKTFREKFDQIEAAMVRWRRDNPLVTVSDETTSLLQHLSGLVWPKGVGDDVPLVVQQNLDAVRALVTRLRAVQGEAKGYADHVVSQMVPVTGFVLQWMREVYERVVDWDEWSGNLKVYVLTPESKHMARKIKEWLAEYTRYQKAYDQLMGAL
jgi:hypothetical protein